MKDKEKALEIANKQKKYYGDPQYIMRMENWSVHECYKSAMQAMQWKEQQMIDKACEWLIKGGYFVNNTETIEDFKKYMKGE